MNTRHTNFFGGISVAFLTTIAGAAGLIQDQPRSDIAVVSPGSNTIQNRSESKAVSVTIQNGELVEVMLNGNPVPAERIKRDGESISIYGENGEVVHRVTTATPIPRPMSAYVPAQAAEPARPPVMVGIRMSEPADSLRSQLNLGDRRAIIVDEVIEGLPAAEAGMRTHDIIIAIDGNENVTPESLHKALMNKAAGDSMQLRVIRGGESKTIRVVLRSYDPVLIGGAGARDADQRFFSPPSPPMVPVTPPRPEIELRGILDRVRARVNDEALRIEIEQVVEEAIRASEKARAAAGTWQGQFLELVPQLRDIPAPGGQSGKWMIDDHNRVIEIPERLATRIESVVPRRDSVEQRLTELEKRLELLSEQIESRMERLLQRLESMADQVEQKLRNEN